MSEGSLSAKVEIDTVIVVDPHGYDEEYNQKTHPGITGDIVNDGTKSVLIIRIPIEQNNHPQTRVTRG
jgi:hypothetical protein